MSHRRFLALIAAITCISPALAEKRAVWEVGVGAVGGYSPVYWGADENKAMGFPFIYFIYRGEDFSFLPNGLGFIDVENTDRFDFGLSVDFSGGVDSEDRLGYGDIDFVGEIGPEVTFGLYATGRSRLQFKVGARAAFDFGHGYTGFVIEPELAFVTRVSETVRLGVSIAPRFGFDGYNQLFYGTPSFAAKDGYIGTDIGFEVSYDLSDRWRIIGDVHAIALGGAANGDSPLYQKDWNVDVRIGFTYTFWRSEDMTAD